MSSSLDLVLALRLHRRGPCKDAVDWLRERPTLTAAQLWDECDRGDWMLWALEAAGVEVPLAWRLRHIVAPALRAAAWVHPDEHHRQDLADAAKDCCAPGAGEDERVRARRAAGDVRASTWGASSAARSAWEVTWAAGDDAWTAAWTAGDGVSAATDAARDARDAYPAHLADAVRQSFDCPLHDEESDHE